MENILHRKEALIMTTIEIIDELGIQGLSTREIAKRQGISEATLFRHYKSKNELLNAVLDYFSQFDDDIFLSIKMKAMDPLDAIFYFISAYTEYYENYPAITSILQITDVLVREADLAEKVRSIHTKRNDNLKLLIDEVKRIGKLQNELDSSLISIMIYGFCREFILNWRMEGQSFCLHERVIKALQLFLGTLNQIADSDDK